MPLIFSESVFWSEQKNKWNHPNLRARFMAMPGLHHFISWVAKTNVILGFQYALQKGAVKTWCVFLNRRTYNDKEARRHSIICNFEQCIVGSDRPPLVSRRKRRGWSITKANGCIWFIMPTKKIVARLIGAYIFVLRVLAILLNGTRWVHV